MLVQESLFMISETLTQVFLYEFIEIFKNIFFYKTFLVAAFVGLTLTQKLIFSRKLFELHIELIESIDW